MDDRGLSSGLFAFVAMLVIAALLYILFYPIAEAVFDHALGSTTDQRVVDAVETRQDIFGLFLLYAIFLAAVWLLARSVIESRA